MGFYGDSITAASPNRLRNDENIEHSLQELYFMKTTLLDYESLLN